jgi:hypothetical protein
MPAMATQYHNSPGNESMSNSLEQGAVKPKWGMSCQQTSPSNQSLTSRRKKLQNFHSPMPQCPPAVSTDLPLEPRPNQFSGKSVTNPLGQDTVRPEWAPDTIGELVWRTSKNAKDVTNWSAIIISLKALSGTDPKIAEEIRNSLKICRNWQEAVCLLIKISVDCGVKFLPQIDLTNTAIIIYKLCADDYIQFLTDNSNALRIKNAAEVLLKINTDDAKEILMQIASLKRAQYVAIILAEMTLLSREKEAAEILMEVDYKVNSEFLSWMCIQGYAAGATEIVKLMNIKNVALIFAVMISPPNAKNAIVILKMIGPEVTVNILQKILALNQHGAAVEIFMGMDSGMMVDMLLFIENVQKTQKTQGDPAKILEIFKLLSQENAIHVFNTMTQFHIRGDLFAAKILATRIEQKIAMEVLATLPKNHAIEIIKLMFANKSYQSGLMAILPSLAQHDKGKLTFASIRITLLTSIVILMFKNKLDAFMGPIIELGGPKLKENLPLELQWRIQSSRNATNEKDKIE